jgi:glycine cleavage system H protein
MSDTPENLKYTQDHEWLRTEDDGQVTLGVTDHAQAALGELVFVELPEVEQVFTDGDVCAVVESVKAASDVFMPLGGSVSAVNEALAEQPEMVNNSPYLEGWLFRFTPESADDVETLMDVNAYRQFLSGLDD